MSHAVQLLPLTVLLLTVLLLITLPLIVERSP